MNPRCRIDDDLPAMRITLTVGDDAVAASLHDIDAARDLASLLPMTVQLYDLFELQKFHHLPRPLAGSDQRQHTYRVGDIAYWPPGPGLVIFYRHDGQTIPPPGVVLLGRVDSGLETLTGSQRPLRARLVRAGPPRLPG